MKMKSKRANRRTGDWQLDPCSDAGDDIGFMVFDLIIEMNALTAAMLALDCVYVFVAHRSIYNTTSLEREEYHLCCTLPFVVEIFF